MQNGEHFYDVYANKTYILFTYLPSGLVKKEILVPKTYMNWQLDE